MIVLPTIGRMTAAATSPWRERGITLLGVLLLPCLAVVGWVVSIWLQPEWHPGDPGPVSDPHGYLRVLSLVMLVPTAVAAALMVGGIVSLVRGRAGGFTLLALVGWLGVAVGALALWSFFRAARTTSFSVAGWVAIASMALVVVASVGAVLVSRAGMRAARSADPGTNPPMLTG